MNYYSLPGHNCSNKRQNKRLFKIMKLSSLMLFLSTALLFAENTYSQKARVTIEQRNARMQTVLTEIENQTDYLFLYNGNQVNAERKVSVDVENMPVNQLLDQMLAGTNVRYVMEGTHIVLSTEKDNESLVANIVASAAVRQTITITGTVTDEAGSPLPGANVTVQGTTTGVITDLNGKYSINIPNRSAVLTFSFIGYTQQDMPVGSNNVVNVTLKEGSEIIEEVVVTALGIKRQTKALSYSSTEVKGDDLSKTPEINLMNSLQGMIAGVDINISGTGAAGSSKVTIRGNTSISRDNNPLYVIDGVPITRSSSSYGSRDMGDALTTLNPNDVESMNVLKGAAATALYGSRASNGVILITTKSGSGKKGFGVSYNGSFGFEYYDNPFKGRQTEYGNSGSNGDNTDTYLSVWNQEVHRNWGPRYDGRNLGIFWNDDPDKPLYYAHKEDHWKQFMRTGHTISNSLDFSGGSDRQRYRVSISDMRYTSPLPNSDMNRQTANISTNSQIGKRVSLNARMNYSTAQSNNRPNPNRYVRILTLIPTNVDIEWLKGPTDKWGANPDGWMLPFSTNDYYQNPYWSAYQDHQEDSRDRLAANADIRIEITSWLSLTGRMGTEVTTLKMTDNDAYGFLRGNINGTGAVTEMTSIYKQFNADYALVFNKTVKDFGLSAMFGGSMTRDKYNRDGIYGNNLLIPFYHVITNAGSLSSTTNNVNQFSQSGINSLYGSAEVSYRNMLYLTFTGRNDWFSMLSRDNNSIFYPSVGLSYLLSSNFTLPSWWSFAKLRASYAEVGGGTSAYATKIAYDINSVGYLGTPYLGIPNTIANPNLLPYSTREYEVGFDFRFYNNRFGIDYAYYDKKTTDDIVNVTLGQSTGYTGATVNLGAISNKGHEIMVSLVPIKRAVEWRLNMAYSYNKGEILDLGGVDEVNAQSSDNTGGGINIKQVVGKQPYGIYGYTQKHVDGQPVWDRWTFNYNGQAHQSWRPGRDADKSLLGYGVHPNAASVSTTVTWKGISLSAMIDGKWGGKLALAAEQEMIERGSSKQTLPGRDGGLFLQGVYETSKDAAGNSTYADITTAPGYTINANPAANLPNPVPVAGNEIPYNVKHFENYYREGFTKRVADMVVYDASYVKFRQLTLAYSIPKSVYRNVPIQSINVSFVARNLFDLYNKLPNGDPSTGGATGLNDNVFPSTRSYTLNLNVNF